MRRRLLAVSLWWSAAQLACVSAGCGGDSEGVSAGPDGGLVASDAGANAGSDAATQAASRSEAPRDASVTTGSTGPIDAGKSSQPTKNSAADAGKSDASAPVATAPDPDTIPWGVALSSSTSRELISWSHTIEQTGARWVRGYDPMQMEESLRALDASDLSLAGILYWHPGTGEPTLPVQDLPGWEGYVVDTINAAKGRIPYWEIWNEPPNFTANKSPADYGKTVRSAYVAAKAADKSVKLGLAAKSVSINYLAQAIDGGARDNFDYITLHPYEVMGLLRRGFEARYLSIVPTLRKMLADKNPAKKDVPIHFTELGQPVGDFSPESQAAQLTKAYVLALAQGVSRIHWFEVTDGDSGRFGLVDVNGVQRPAFVAMSTLIEALGAQPKYIGWTKLAEQALAFVFMADSGPVAVAWAPPDTTLDVMLGKEAGMLTLGTTKQTRAQALKLTNAPVLLRNVDEALVQQASGNVGKPFPWGGDFTGAKVVSYDLTNGEAGLHLLGAEVPIMVDGLPAHDASKEAGISIAVDPNFNSYDKVRLSVEVTVRRNSDQPASFTLRYESVDGWKAAGEKYEIPGSDQWYKQTWEITDPQFVGMWGHSLALDSEMMANSNYSLLSVRVTKL